MEFNGGIGMAYGASVGVLQKYGKDVEAFESRY